LLWDEETFSYGYVVKGSRWRARGRRGQPGMEVVEILLSLCAWM
jgi:hypothetical protein